MKANNQKTKKIRLYNLDIPIIGITGGIGTGKSTLIRALKEDHFQTLSADELIKNIYKKKETHTFLNELNPHFVKNDEVNFNYLREIFFTNQEIKESVEHFIYKNLREAFMVEFNKLKKPGLLFYEVPLLFEKNLTSFFDLTLLVYAPYGHQLKRAQIRDHAEEKIIKTIINSQLPIEEKKKLADYVFDNSEDEDHFQKEYLKLKNYLNNHFIL